MFKKVVLILSAFACTSAFAFDLTIIGENHQSQECKAARREYIQQALDQKLHLGMEGLMLDDLAFNQDIAKTFPKGGFVLTEQTQLYGLEEKQLYALAGLYMNQSLMEIAKRLFVQGMTNQQGRIFQAAAQFVDLVRKYPEIAKLYYGEGKVPSDILTNLKSQLNLMFTDNGVNIVEVDNFEKRMQQVSKDYRKLLNEKKLYPIDEQRLNEAGPLAAKDSLTSTVAAETYYYNYMLRDDLMATSTAILIDRIKAKGRNELYIITGRRHALAIQQKINDKKIPDLSIQVNNLCY